MQANLKETFDELKSHVQKMITENYSECGFADTVLMEIASVIETTAGKGYSVHVTPKKQHHFSWVIQKHRTGTFSFRTQQSRILLLSRNVVEKPMAVQLCHLDD